MTRSLAFGFLGQLVEGDRPLEHFDAAQTVLNGIGVEILSPGLIQAHCKRVSAIGFPRSWRIARNRYAVGVVVELLQSA